MSIDGPALHSLLSSLGMPGMDLLTPEGMDWLFESNSCLPFLQWVVASLGQDNVVEEQDLTAFSGLPCDKLLSGQILTAALASCGLGEGQLSDQQLERQVAELEQELALQEECRDKLEHIKERLGDQAVREQARAGQVEHLVERAERDERRKQEQVLVMNSSYNEVVGRLVSAVMKVSGVYQAAKPDEDNPMFISSVPLDRIRAADTCLEEELQRLLETYFNKGMEVVGVDKEQTNPIIDINDPVCLELVKGRDKQEFELLVSEINRLRVSFCQAEVARLTYQAEEAGWKAVVQLLSSQMNLVGQNKGITATPRRVRPEIIEPREKLEKEMVELVGQLANLHCQHILAADYKTKVRRNKLVVERLEGVRDILLQQVTRREILTVAMNREMMEVEMVKNIFESIIQDFKEETVKANNFKTAMRSLRVRNNDANLIPPEDLVMLGAHRVLQNHGLVGHLATYNAVREAVEDLETKKKKLGEKLEEFKTSRRDEVALMEKKISKVLKLLNVNDSGVTKNISLAPKDIKNGINSLDSGLKDIERVAKKLLDRWEKDKSELKIKPHLRLQREVWVDFLVKPQVLSANVKSLVNKVKD
eukprot:TRINITY_DN32670_c0_g1_i1.p1 TRINITY_DN32670_c0_g1~~TRINITY_DN32670_c0_g1_i1.p1  ORF type:complete len:592 (-),score=265.83 TRINITY_DN32670_c0_g1_i1:50-1825(-)